MLDLTCPRCGRRYYADEDKIGLSILCTTPFCSELIPVVSSGSEHRFRHFRYWEEGKKLPKTNTVWIALAVLGCVAVPLGTAVAHHASSAEVRQQKENFLSAPRRAANSKNYRNLSFPSLQSITAPPVAQSGNQRLSAPDSKLRVSLPTGTSLFTVNGNTGLSSLKVENGTNQDAVVKLVSSLSHRTYREIYVRAGDTWTIPKILRGTYLLLVLQGEGWIDEDRGFESDNSYRQFDRLLAFSESSAISSASGGSTQTETTWSQETVTLHKLINGNAQTHLIDQKAFDASN